MIIALASPRVAATLEEGLEKVRQLVSEASARGMGWKIRAAGPPPV